MTLPRIVVPGATYLLTRRATRRHYLFRPDDDRTTQNNFLYCLAVASRKHGVEVCAMAQMSTHHHVVPTDPRAELGNFMRDFHRDLANVTKCHRGWPEEVFNGAPPSAVPLESPEAMIKEIAYTIAQPVAAGAVKYGEDWPGVLTRVADIGRRVLRVKRPRHYFAANNVEYPEYVELRLTIPKTLIEHFGSDDAVRAAVQVEVDRLENDARRKAAEAGRSFLGAKRAVRTPFTKRARSTEELGKLNPKFAAGGNGEAARRAIAKLRAFHAAYRAALDAWTRGFRDAVFPFGTWWMRIHHGAACEPPPTPC